MKTFDTQFSIYFEDISPSGKVHLEKIAEWMSMTREQYFKSTCPNHLNFVESTIKMFTANISINIVGAAKWTDTIKAILTTANIKKISFEMYIDFQNEKTGDIVARTIQKVAFVDISNNKFANVPEDMKSVIINYVKDR